MRRSTKGVRVPAFPRAVIREAELSPRNAQTFEQLSEHAHGRVAPGALDVAHVVLCHAGSIAQLLLGDVACVSELAEEVAKKPGILSREQRVGTGAWPSLPAGLRVFGHASEIRPAGLTFIQL